MNLRTMLTNTSAPDYGWELSAVSSHTASSNCNSRPRETKADGCCQGRVREGMGVSKEKKKNKVVVFVNSAPTAF